MISSITFALSYMIALHSIATSKLNIIAAIDSAGGLDFSIKQTI